MSRKNFRRWTLGTAGLLAGLVLVLLATAPAVLSDDGPMVRKEVSRTPSLESEDAQLSMMQFYLDATRASGELTTIEYYADRDGDNQPDELMETRSLAKPLVVTYYDEAFGVVGSSGSPLASTKSGTEVGPDIKRDAWAAWSFDDGNTWKERNLSESALETSFTLENGIVFPGDVTQVAHAVAGNKILVAWFSKYCDQGSPRYSAKADTDLDGNGELDDPLYEDLFDVAGNQGSIDYAEWMHHGEYPFADVGEIPFSCVWTARGTVQQVANPQTGLSQWGILWRKAERLTSGKRDAYYVALDGVEGAGFSVAWQEDPEGLRPGYGEGPGIGWSGATVNHKTDIWYSFIGWDDFDVMQDADGNPTLDPSVLDGNKPKVYEPMAMPSRITDNYNCLSDRVDSDGNPHPGFCFEDFDANGIADLCAATYPWTNSQGEVKNICVTEDGRLLNGQVGSSRARMVLEGYTRPDGTRSAWVVLAYEETKGLGAGHTDIEPLDIGKDTMYHSFDMFQPDVAMAGHMLNLPETDPLSDPENPTVLPLVLNDKAEYQYQTAIGRRPSLIVQPASKIATALPGTTTAAILFKDGTDRQGGPSDIFLRRFVLPAGFDRTRDNPYDVANLTCDLWDTAIVTSSPSAYQPAYYPDGVCVRGAINVSATTPLTFEALDNGTPSHGITERVLTWEQTAANLDDDSWVNKYDVAKGHRGFLDGDFLMIMYAYSPNWLATSHGHEPYNLYIRRSFDGGLTWTTTPAALGGTGVAYDQIFGVGDLRWTVTRSLAAGDFEPARNVSQLTSNKETVLDPRYSPTNIGTQSDVNRVLQADGTYAFYQPYPLDDTRDPSKFFAVFETGDATTVEVGGEADPLDLFYSRATVYGDFWDTYDHYVQSTGLYEERWDWLENKKDDLSGEASVGASPSGTFLWTVWNQWKETADGHVYESDPVFRRLWWDDTVVLVALAGTYEAEAGELVTLTGTVLYDGFDDLLYAWDLDNDGVFETEGLTVTIPTTGAAQPVAFRACEANGACDIDQGWVNPDPFTPRVWRIQGEPAPALVGTPIDFSGRFNAPGTLDVTHTLWSWGDGSAPEMGAMPADLQGQGASWVTGTHAFEAAGVYPVMLSVTDAEGRVGYDYEYFPVYDPAAGRITGDGEIAVAGQSFAFEFDAQYDKNKGYLKGEVTVSLNDGASVFEATSLEWLVVEADGMAHLKASGTLDGKGGYELFLTVWDGGKSAEDLARVRIAHRGAGKSGHLLYDSQPGDPVGGDAATVLTEGNVTLHVK